MKQFLRFAPPSAEGDNAPTSTRSCHAFSSAPSMHLSKDTPSTRRSGSNGFKVGESRRKPCPRTGLLFHSAPEGVSPSFFLSFSVFPHPHARQSAPPHSLTPPHSDNILKHMRTPPHHRYKETEQLCRRRVVVDATFQKKSKIERKHGKDIGKKRKREKKEKSRSDVVSTTTVRFIQRQIMFLPSNALALEAS